MYPPKSLSVCLCIEDLDSCICGILINQLGSGQLFGLGQTFQLKLQSTAELEKLEDFSLDVQDCAFPVIKDVSCHKTFSDMACPPDVILILLSNRSFPHVTDSPATEQFQRLLSLVSYINQLSSMLSVLELDNIKIIITGDLALTAASVMSMKLNNLSANQLMAIDVQQRDQSKVGLAQGCYIKAKRICETVKQWWSGIKMSASTYLGLKYLNPAWRTHKSQGNGYFFSTPISLSGPMKFVSRSDLHIDQDHIAEVKATTDQAFRIVKEMNGQCSEDEKEAPILCLAQL